MANYTVNDIKDLRESTGAGMMEVKKALDEADGDKQRAIEIIRVKGLAKAAKRVDRETGEGLVAASVNSGLGFLIELNSETDFVAKSDVFVKLADEVLAAVVESGASNVDDALKAKTSEGTVEDSITQKSATLGEKIVLKNVAKVEGEVIGQYLHKKDPSLPPASGTLVAFTKEIKPEDAVKVAMHITGFPPEYDRIEDVPQDVIDSETRVAKEKNAGKPENIMDKIVEGSLSNFYKENVLLEQNLAFDETVSIKSLLNGGELLSYAFFKVGA